MSVPRRVVTVEFRVYDDAMVPEKEDFLAALEWAADDSLVGEGESWRVVSDVPEREVADA